MPLPFLALRLGDLARAAGLRAGDLALAAGFRAGDLARPRGFGAGDAARLALRVATMSANDLWEPGYMLRHRGRLHFWTGVAATRVRMPHVPYDALSACSSSGLFVRETSRSSVPSPVSTST